MGQDGLAGQDLTRAAETAEPTGQVARRSPVATVHWDRLAGIRADTHTERKGGIGTRRAGDVLLELGETHELRWPIPQVQHPLRVSVPFRRGNKRGRLLGEL